LKKHWSFRTYVKKYIGALLRAIKTDKNTAVADKQRKELFK